MRKWPNRLGRFASATLLSIEGVRSTQRLYRSTGFEGGQSGPDQTRTRVGQLLTCSQPTTPGAALPLRLPRKRVKVSILQDEIPHGPTGWTAIHSARP